MKICFADGGQAGNQLEQVKLVTGMGKEKRWKRAR